MSYELGNDLSWVLIDMESVLDRKITRSDMLAAAAGYQSQLDEEANAVSDDDSVMQRLEDEVEQLK